MKVTIDETIFNKAIKENKLELAKWLLDMQCPTDKSCYLQRLQLDTLNWLKFNAISIPPNLLHEIIENTSDYEIVQWFIKNDCKMDKNSLYSCIKTKNNELFFKFIKNIKIDSEAYKVALISENIEILEYLRRDHLELLNEEMKDYALKHKRKESIRWLVLNDLL